MAQKITQDRKCGISSFYANEPRLIRKITLDNEEYGGTTSTTVSAAANIKKAFK